MLGRPFALKKPLDARCNTTPTNRWYADALCTVHAISWYPRNPAWYDTRLWDIVYPLLDVVLMNGLPRYRKLAKMFLVSPHAPVSTSCAPPAYVHKSGTACRSRQQRRTCSTDSISLSSIADAISRIVAPVSSSSSAFTSVFIFVFS